MYSYYYGGTESKYQPKDVFYDRIKKESYLHVIIYYYTTEKEKKFFAQIFTLDVEKLTFKDNQHWINFN